MGRARPTALPSKTESSRDRKQTLGELEGHKYNTGLKKGKFLAMIRSRKTYTFWANHITSNPYPAMTVPNFSLGKTAKSLEIYIPLHSAEENVNFVTKEISPAKNGGEALDLLKPSFQSEMGGSGLSADDIAFLHPIKV